MTAALLKIVLTAWAVGPLLAVVVIEIMAIVGGVK